MGTSAIQELALYHLDTTDTSRLADSSVAAAEPSGRFSARRYSRYKYGCPHSTDWFAHRLVALLVSHCPAILTAARVLITSSPYHRVPTAAHTLATSVCARLNTARAARGRAPARLVHIHRQVVTAGDYGRLPAVDRALVMAANRLSCHQIPAVALPGAQLVVVDDIRVTGAHQRCLAAATDALPVAARTFVHIAALAAGPVDPTVEDRLNHAQVATLADLAEIAATPGFAWNVRVCKFLLGPANRAALPAFLRDRPEEFVRDLCTHTRRDGYHAMPLYRPSHALVTAELRRRASQPARSAR